MSQQPTPSRGSNTAAEVFTAIGLAVTLILAIISIFVSCSQIVNFVRPGSTPNSFPLLVAIVTFGASATVSGALLVIFRLIQGTRRPHLAPRQAQSAVEAKRREEATQLARQGPLNYLLRMTPTEFDLAIAELFTFLGYTKFEYTGGAADLATDLVCYDATGQKTVVQCKRCWPGDLVDFPEIQTFIGRMVAHHPPLPGIYVTTSSYTGPALDLGRQHHIEMIDGTTLADRFLAFRAAREKK